MSEVVKKTAGSPLLKERRNGPGKAKNAALSRRKILKTALMEFTAHGFDGARMDTIANKAKVNKQLIYYYYKSKDNLFIEALKECYRRLREVEAGIDFSSLTAYEGILKLVEANWAYYEKNPQLIYLLASENLLNARHIKKRQTEFWEINKQWLEVTQSLIDKGRIDHSIRDGLNPIQLNISIAGLIIFSIMNKETLSLSMNVDLHGDEAKKERLSHIKDIIATWICPSS